MSTWFLTMVIMMNGNLTSFSISYNTKDACEVAKQQNREALRQGSVILASCTKQ